MARFPLHPARVIFLVAAITFLGTGCLTTSPRMHSFADSIRHDLPDLELEHRRGVRLGRVSLGLAKGIAKWALLEDEDEEVRDIFRGVKKVEVATFAARGHEDAAFPRRLVGGFERDGWLTLARFREDREFAWVLYRTRRGSLNRVLVAHLDEEELVLIRLGGRLDRVIEAALSYARTEIVDDDDLGRTVPSETTTEWSP